MERAKNKDEKKLRWKKIGGGSFRMGKSSGGRLIKPGQTFTAYDHDIPMGFRDTIILLDPASEKEAEVPVVVEKPEYTVKHRSGGYYNILDSNGKVMNEEAIKGKEDAEKFIEDLQA